METTPHHTAYKSLSFLGYPAYRVGDDGSVWSCYKHRGGPGRVRIDYLSDRWRRLVGKPHPNGGHLRVVLCNQSGHRSMFVHRLVLMAFAGPCPDGLIGCHNDGNPANNRLENLRWGTPASNLADRDAHGRTARGAGHGRTPFTDEDVRVIRKTYAAGTSQKLLARKYNVAKSCIWAIVTGRSWRHIELYPRHSPAAHVSCGVH